MTRSMQFHGETELALRPTSTDEEIPGHRRARRKTWCREVVLRDEQGWGPIRLPATNISACGLFVTSNLLFEPGQGFLLEFDSPKLGSKVRVWSRVSRVSQPGCPASGMGFEFLDLSEDHQDAIAEYTLQ